MGQSRVLRNPEHPNEGTFSTLPTGENTQDGNADGLTPADRARLEMELADQKADELEAKLAEIEDAVDYIKDKIRSVTQFIASLL